MAHRGMTAEAREFQTESDMRTLRDADRIRGSKARMKAVETMANKTLKVVKGRPKSGSAKRVKTSSARRTKK